MSGLWNYLFSFYWEKPLTSYTVDELNAKLKELELEKHLDLIERSFEIHRSIIIKLKEENDALKKEIHALKLEKVPANPFITVDSATAATTSKVPYPDLKRVICFAKWSNLQYNFIESKIFDKMRNKLVENDIEISVEAWHDEIVTAQPIIVFCPLRGFVAQDLDSALSAFKQKKYACIILVMLHERENVTECIEPPTNQVISQTNLPCQVHLIVDMIYWRRRYFDNSLFNEMGIAQISEFISKYEPGPY